MFDLSRVLFYPGIDSVMLLEAGFTVSSADASDKMLKSAYKTRWDRRKEEIMDKWVIYEANWLHLMEDIEEVSTGKSKSIKLAMESSPTT